MENENVKRAFEGTRGVLLFFLRFVIASIVLYLIYTKLGVYYTKLVAYGAKPLLAIFKYRLVMERALKVTEDISLNPVVFLSLVIATGNVTLVTKLRAALWGFVILTAGNVVTIFLLFLYGYTRSETLGTGIDWLNLTINFFLPLLLWFILLPIRSLLPFRSSST